MEKWTSQHLDLILKKGDDLYNIINSSHDYVLVNEIPQVIYEFGGQYKVEKYQEMFGLLYCNNSSGDYLGERLHTVLKSMKNMMFGPMEYYVLVALDQHLDHHVH